MTVTYFKILQNIKVTTRDVLWDSYPASKGQISQSAAGAELHSYTGRFLSWLHDNLQYYTFSWRNIFVTWLCKNTSTKYKVCATLEIYLPKWIRPPGIFFLLNFDKFNYTSIYSYTCINFQFHITA